MNNSDLQASLNTRKLVLVFEKYNSLINSYQWLSKVKLDDRTELANNYEELVSGWLEGYESVLHQYEEGIKYSFEVDLDEHLSYLDEYKRKHRL